jgi:hypothetical protein
MPFLSTTNLFMNIRVWLEDVPEPKPAVGCQRSLGQRFRLI